MSTRPATEALIAYVRGTDEDDLSDYLSRMKMVWDWDDVGFRELVDLVSAALLEVEHDDQIPKSLAWVFSSYVPSLESLMRNPDFEQRNRAGRTPEQTASYFEPRRQLLRDLQTWFNCGPLPAGYAERVDPDRLP